MVLRLQRFIKKTFDNDRKEYQLSENAKCNIKRKDEFYKVEYNINDTIEEESPGEKRLKLLISFLEKFDKLGYKRSTHQIYFHKAFIGACLKKILKDDYTRDLEKIIKKYDIESTTSDVIITTPRRFGKTISVAQFAAAFLLSQPEIEISIYSTGRRASSKLVEKIRDFVVLLTATKDSVISFRGKEILSVKGPNGKPCVCGSYPSKVAISINPIYHLFVCLFIYL
jgi:hypothetical protein